MLALLLALSADAGTMRAIVEVGPDGPEIVDLIPSRSTPDPLPNGDLSVVDADGRVLHSFGVPDPRHRSVITPEGGEVGTLETARIDVVVDWPDAAVALVSERRSLTPRTGHAPLRTAVSGVVLVQEAGPSDQRLDLVFLAEGYTAAQQADFADDVDWIVGYLQSIEPYADYATLFNIWRVDLVSNQSGADHPELGTSVDTALGCYYDCAGIDRLLCCDDTTVMNTVLSTVPDAEGVMVLVNDPTYGGAGGFSYATSYVGRDLGHQVAAHELGHSMVGLWDEYGYGSGGNLSDVGPNCANDPSPHWTEWLDAPGVDSFQECSYTQHYRPTENECMMRTLADDYCPVCRQEVVLAMYARVPGIVTATTPEEGAEFTEGEIVVETVIPARKLDFEWSIDGVPVSTEPTFAVACGEPGGELSLTVRDNTAYVRSDPQGLLEDDVGPWTLTPAACTEPTATDLAELCGCSSAPGTSWTWLLLPLLGLRRRR